MAIGSLIAAVLLGGAVVTALLALVAVVLPAAAAGVLGVVARRSALLALPLAVSAALVNVLFTPGGATVVAELGPLTVTGQGISLAVEVVVRVFTMAGAVALFYATTPTGSLVASLQHHGVPPRLTFVIHSGVAMIPRLTDRASEVSAAQRARGLETEGRPWRRARGVLAVAAPTVLGALAEVETRTVALESRAFTRPGRHTVLRAPDDDGIQRLLRWSVAAALALLALSRVVG